MDPQTGERQRVFPVHVLLLTLLVLASYGASLLGDFVWDDRLLIVENDRVHGLGHVDELLTSSFWETGDRHDRFRSFFRPVVGLSYAADHAIWGLRPLGFHVSNVLLHLVCCVLVYAVARQERLADWVAFSAAALFAVHPVHVESVAWISGRTDLICTALVLGAFLLHRRATRASRAIVPMALATLLFLLALFAKEMAVMFPLLVALDRWLERRRVMDALSTAWPFLGVLAGYILIRHALIGATAEPLWSLGVAAWAATAVFVVARYLTLLILPIGLDAHYPHQPLESMLSTVALVSGVMLAIVAFAIHRLARRSPRNLYWLLWILVFLGPVLAFGRFGDVIMADRFLYLPSVGLCLLAARGVGLLVDRGRRSLVRVTAVAVGVVLVVLGAASFTRTRVWTSDYVLFSDMVRTSPGSALVRSNLGLALFRRGEFDQAISEYERAIEIEPTYSMAYNNLAVALEGQGRPHEALRAYQAALAIVPDHLEASINAGQLLTRVGRTEPGLALLRETVRRHPRHPLALYALAAGLARKGRTEDALAHLETARRLDPGYADVYYLLGKIRHDQGRREQAIEAMRVFLALWPHEEDAWTRVARRIIRQSENERASLPAALGPGSSHADGAATTARTP